MRTVGIVLILFGVLMLAQAGILAHRAPNPSYMIGTFMPGLGLLIVGLWLCRPASSADDADE